MKRTKIQAVEESEYGLYVWQMPNGQWVGDGDGNFMNIASKKGDLEKIIALRKAARYFGITDGEPVFLSNRRRVSAAEYEHQKERLIDGKVADELDYAAMEEAARHNKS